MQEYMLYSSIHAVLVLEVGTHIMYWLIYDA